MQVRWDQDKCCHTGVCVSSLPKVFKIVDGQFVIDTTQGSDEAIQNVADQCPSGALQIVNEQ